MKKLGLFLATITLSFSAFADEVDGMYTALVQGTKTICSNDKKPVAYESNLQVAIPESAVDGISTFSMGDVQLNRDVKVSIGSRACTLPKGAVLEKAVIKIYCSQGSKLRYIDDSTGEWYDEDLSEDNKKICGGSEFMFKRIAVNDLTYRDDRYFLKTYRHLYYTDTKEKFAGKNEAVGRYIYQTSTSTKFQVPYVTGAYVPNNN